MTQNIRVPLTKLRNAIVDGAQGSVTSSNSLLPTVAFQDILDKLLANGKLGTTEVKPVFQFYYRSTPDLGAVDAVMAATPLYSARTLSIGITQPDTPRLLSVKGSASGIAGNVVINGKDMAGNSISDTIALSGTGTVNGVKAFKEVHSVDFPAATHAGTKQKETMTVAGTVTQAGNAKVTVTAGGMGGSPREVAVPVLVGDTGLVLCNKIRAALAADVDTGPFFTFTGTTTVIAEANLPAANDATMNFALDNDTCLGITAAGTSADTTAGVAPDSVQVGTADKIGIPSVLPGASWVTTKLFNGSADGGTVTADATDLSKNVYAPAGTLDGAKALELFYMA